MSPLLPLYGKSISFTSAVMKHASVFIQLGSRVNVMVMQGFFTRLHLAILRPSLHWWYELEKE